jgi:hypothetical protein
MFDETRQDCEYRIGRYRVFIYPHICCVPKHPHAVVLFVGQSCWMIRRRRRPQSWVSHLCRVTHFLFNTHTHGASVRFSFLFIRFSFFSLVEASGIFKIIWYTSCACSGNPLFVPQPKKRHMWNAKKNKTKISPYPIFTIQFKIR